jgi:hypothetical protein
LKENAMNKNLLIGVTAFGFVTVAATVSSFAGTVHKHPRTITALQASLNSCSHQTNGQKRTATAFQQCMGAHGYQLASTMRAAAAAQPRIVTQQATAGLPAYSFSVGSSDVSSDPTPSAPAYSNQDMLNDMQRTNDANAAATQQNNAAMEAATQTEVLFNTVYFPPNN